MQIANLQMAKARQQRIQAALSNQVDQCAREIDRIDAKINALCEHVGLAPIEQDDDPSADAPAAEDDGFSYAY
ncbi:hypothetical protein [Salisaeta longa]|uniref:hypothetical protein n=1 Tax=Salisaeta longa TaxID=503170 RepID=UPI0003B74B78|nr:hypothetical protein [Salisaeta longa]